MSVTLSLRNSRYIRNKNAYKCTEGQYKNTYNILVPHFHMVHYSPELINAHRNRMENMLYCIEKE